MADRMAISQVAEEAGVSATVSTVLHGEPGASQEIRRHVQEAAAGADPSAYRVRRSGAVSCEPAEVITVPQGRGL